LTHPERHPVANTLRASARTLEVCAYTEIPGPRTASQRLRTFFAALTSAIGDFQNPCRGFCSKTLLTEHLRTVFNSRNPGCPRPPQTPAASF
jgi:hypothetical protein